MSNPAWVKAAQNFWHALVHDSQKEVIDDITPLIAFLEAKGGPAILAVAVAIISGASPTAPWADLIAQFVPVAEAAGEKLLAEEAGIILNLAKAKLGAQAAA